MAAKQQNEHKQSGSALIDVARVLTRDGKQETETDPHYIQNMNKEKNNL
jgi:hypothetical protein